MDMYECSRVFVGHVFVFLVRRGGLRRRAELERGRWGIVGVLLGILSGGVSRVALGERGCCLFLSCWRLSFFSLAVVSAVLSLVKTCCARRSGRCLHRRKPSEPIHKHGRFRRFHFTFRISAPPPPPPPTVVLTGIRRA